jgi:hypothetical protein
VIEEPVVENLEEESNQSCSVRNAPFESIEDNEPSIPALQIEPLMRSEES